VSSALSNPAPNLVLLRPGAGPQQAASAAALDGNTEVLGLGLAERTTRAARRAGYGRVFRLGAASAPTWGEVAAALANAAPAPLLVAPATILGETEWLERLAAAPQDGAPWAATPGRFVWLGAAATTEALEALVADGEASGFDKAQACLTRRFGPPAALPPANDPPVLASAADIAPAERRLLRSLVKESDGFMARHVERPISLAISRRLAATAVTPNEITLVSVLIGLMGAPFFLSPLAKWQTLGALLLLAHSIIDGCDGEIARLRFEESRWGGVLDFWGDNIVHSAIFACMAAGWSRSDGGWLPLLLGSSAVLGTLATASFVYWRVMRAKRDAGPLFTSVARAPSRPLARLLDALSRRDFIYLIIAFALFGRADWFLLLTGLGAPIFFAAVVFLEMRQNAAKVTTASAA